jgi:hypothetical protein
MGGSGTAATTVDPVVTTVFDDPGRRVWIGAVLGNRAAGACRASGPSCGFRLAEKTGFVPPSRPVTIGAVGMPSRARVVKMR